MLIRVTSSVYVNPEEVRSVVHIENRLEVMDEVTILFRKGPSMSVAMSKLEFRNLIRRLNEKE